MYYVLMHIINKLIYLIMHEVGYILYSLNFIKLFEVGTIKLIYLNFYISNLNIVAFYEIIYIINIACRGWIWHTENGL